MKQSRKNHVLEQLKSHQIELHEAFGVKTIALFGSTARGQDTPESDVDLLVEFDPKFNRIGLFAFLRLKHRLEELIQARVDLTTPNGLKTWMRDEVLNEAVYAG
jgi:hypothetical protein